MKNAKINNDHDTENLNISAFQTPPEFETYVRDQLANNRNYRHLTYTQGHAFGYDAAWTIALALNHSAEVLKTTSFSDGGIRHLEHFTYDDHELMMVFFESLSRVYFQGVTVRTQLNERSHRVCIA